MSALDFKLYMADFWTANAKKAMQPAPAPLKLTPEERKNLRAGCQDNETHFNGSANVDADTVLKALAYVEELEKQIEYREKEIYWQLYKLRNHADQGCLDMESVKDAADNLHITLD